MTLTEADIAAIEQRVETLRKAFLAVGVRLEWEGDVPNLIAEVRRLRGAIEKIAEDPCGGCVSEGTHCDMQVFAEEVAVAGIEGTTPPAPRRIHLGGGLEVEVCEGCYQRMKPSLTGGPDAEAHGGGTP